MFKSDIINLLGRKHHFTSYLEICTPTSGLRYSEIDRRQFTSCKRLMYRWRSDFADGSDVDYPVAEAEIGDVMADLYRTSARFDVILVDPWHSYESSLSNLRDALPLLSESGALVVHDCSPPDIEVASPSAIPDFWCGVTYAALIDFVAGEPDVDLYTVDTDLGCAVVRRRTEVGAASRGLRPDPEALKLWDATGPDFNARYRYFDSQRAKLINLISVDEFLDRECLRAIWKPLPAQWLKGRPGPYWRHGWDRLQGHLAAGFHLRSRSHRARPRQ